MLKHARGEFDNPHAGPHEKAAREQEFRDVLAQHFGDKAEAVSLAIEKEAKLSKPKIGQESGYDENGVPVAAESLDRSASATARTTRP